MNETRSDVMWLYVFGGVVWFLSCESLSLFFGKSWGFYMLPVFLMLIVLVRSCHDASLASHCCLWHLMGRETQSHVALLFDR